MVIENKEALLAKIDAALDDVRPFLKVDGGNVELIDIDDDMNVSVKWLGTCQNCSMSVMTMKAGIEQAIKSRLPQVQHVIAVNGLS